MNSLARLSRFIVTLAALFFAGLGFAFWFAPQEAAELLGIEAANAAGTTALRADLGGLFLGFALLCGGGAWFRRRSRILAAATLLGTIVAGRLLGWTLDGTAAGGLRELAIELVALAGLLGYARGLRVPEAAAREGWRPIAVLGAIAAALLVLVFLLLLNPTVEQKVFDRAAQAMTARTNDAPLADDALRVAICGSSAPLPSASRAKACVAVFAGGKFYVVDVGPESVENLVLWGIPLSKIGGVLLTHYHSDHIGDLGELQLQTWAGGRPEKLAVYGGPGVEALVNGFNEAYRLDQGYRTAHHGEKVMPSATWGMVAHTVELDGPPTSGKDRTGLVFDQDGLKITAIEVDHAPIAPAYAYRFDYKGRSVVVTGDMKYHPPLVKSAAGADLLVSEAISRTMTHSLESAARGVKRDRTAAIMHDVQDYHVSPEEVAQIANQANVKLLAFYHLLPAPDGFLARRLFAHGVNEVRKGEWTMADDGSLYTLPLGSREVKTGRM
jgi:ribonuclease Z